MRLTGYLAFIQAFLVMAVSHMARMFTTTMTEVPILPPTRPTDGLTSRAASRMS